MRGGMLPRSSLLWILRFSEDDILSVKRFPMSERGGCHDLSRVRNGTVISVQPGSKAL